MSGNAVVARMLVQAGASLGVRDLDGNTPIHAATVAKHIDSLQALLAPIEKNIVPKQLLPILNLKNYDGKSLSPFLLLLILQFKFKFMSLTAIGSFGEMDGILCHSKLR